MKLVHGFSTTDPAEGTVHLETTKCCVSVNPSGKSTSVLSRRHRIKLIITEADLLICPPTPWSTAEAEGTFLGSRHFGRVGAHKPICTFLLPTFFSLQGSGGFHSRSCSTEGRNKR